MNEHNDDNATMVKDLDDEELADVHGGMCVYKSEEYSEGSVVNMEGYLKTCGSDGTWH